MLISIPRASQGYIPLIRAKEEVEGIPSIMHLAGPDKPARQLFPRNPNDRPPSRTAAGREEDGL